MPSTKLEMNQTQLKHLAELLLGVAYADGDYDGSEATTISDVLHQLVVGQDLPSDVSMHLLQFDIDNLSITDACNGLALEDEDQRAAVLYLLSRVADADGVYDSAESDYITAVGQALGAKPHEYEEYAIEIIFTPTPPPLPVH